MAFFDQIKDMAKAAAVKSEEFVKNVGEKAEAAMEMQKLSSEMEKKERFINDNYMQMGMELHKKAVEGEAIPEYLLEYCKLIDTTMLEIGELQTKIDLIKQEQFGASPAKVPCPHCGQEVLASSKFCPECGGAMAQEKPETTKGASEQAEEEKQEEAVTDNKSAETTKETEKCSETDAAANAEAEKFDASLAAEAQPEQVNSNADAVDTATEPVADKVIEEAEQNNSSPEPVDGAVKEAEVMEAEPVKRTEAGTVEEVTDAEIVEPVTKFEEAKKS